MARFEVTGPDGSRYVVNAPDNAPDNATNEQVVAFAQGEAAKGAGRSPNYFDQFDPPDRGGNWWEKDPIVSPGGRDAGGKTIRVAHPNGQLVEFPEGTSPETISRNMRQFDGHGGNAREPASNWWQNDPIVSPAQTGGPDLPKIKRNIKRMIEQNAPESDIEAYIASEGVTAEQLRAHKQGRSQTQGNYFDQFDAPNAAAEKVPSWSEVPGKALSNVPESAARTAYNMAYPFLHPIDTAQALGNIAYGAGSKVAGAIGIEQDPQRKAANEAQINAVGQFFAERYGGEEALRKTLAEDPVGVAADLAAVLSGGAALTARAPGIAGKASQAATRAANVIDPVTNAGRLARGTGRAVAEVFGTTTGAGSAPLKTAFRAGRNGNTAFRENMRGQAPITDTLDMAKSAVGTMRQERSDAYARNMGNTDASFKRLDLRPVAKSIETAAYMVNLQGKSRNFSRSAEASETVRQIAAKFEEFNALDDAMKLTPRGVDALKQAMGEIRQSTKPGTLSRSVADRVYNSVKSTIVKQVPDYANAMRAYSQASDQLDDITRTFSLGENAAKDTAIRKLTSTMRNNVNNNYGRREQLLDVLAQHEPDLPYAVAGQALNTWSPRGISNPVMGGAGLLGYSINPAMLPAFAAASPRIAGEAAYAAGKATGGIDNVLEALRVTPGLASDAAQSGYAVNALTQPQAVLSGSQTGSYPNPTLHELLGLYLGGQPRDPLALPPPQ